MTISTPRSYANHTGIRLLLALVLGCLGLAHACPTIAQSRETHSTHITVTGILVNQGVAPPIPEDPAERYPNDREENYDEVTITYTTYAPTSGGPYYHYLNMNLVAKFWDLLFTWPLDRTYTVGYSGDTLTPPGETHWEVSFFVRTKSTVLTMGLLWRYMHYHFSVDAYLWHRAIAPNPAIVDIDTAFSADVWRERVQHSDSWWTQLWDDRPIQSP